MSATPTARWRPVFEGDEAAAVRRQALADAEVALTELAASDAFPLIAGAVGAAVLADAVAAAGAAGHPQHAVALVADRAARLAAERVAAAERGEAPRTLPGLWRGIAGLRWMLLRADLDDRLAAYDDELLAWVRRPRQREWDLINGVVGVGVTGLELCDRGHGSALLDAVIARLAAMAVRDGDGVAWPVVRGDSRPELRDLGVAHGQPGAIGLLTLASERPGALELLRDAVSWFAARIEPRPAVAAVPYFTPCADGTPPSRLAWCYGDAGVAVVLFCAAAVLGDPVVADLAADVAARAVERPLEGSGVVDPGLCHGAAGLGHLFGRLWQLTGGEEFRQAALGWLRLVPGQRLRDGVPGLYPARDEFGVYRSDPGVLTGSAGVCLALLAASSDRDPSWDRIMLAS